MAHVRKPRGSRTGLGEDPWLVPQPLVPGTVWCHQQLAIQGSQQLHRLASRRAAWAAGLINQA